LILVQAGFRLRQGYVGLVTRPDKGGLKPAPTDRRRSRV